MKPGAEMLIDSRGGAILYQNRPTTGGAPPQYFYPPVGPNANSITHIPGVSSQITHPHALYDH